MALSKLLLARSLARTLAITGVLAAVASANAPYSDETHTETALPQDIGSMTSDGYLIFSVNHCTIVQTTACQVSFSTGGPVPDESTSASGVPGTWDATASTADYPTPTGGETASVPGRVDAPTSTVSGSPAETGPVSGTHSHSHLASETTGAPTRTEELTGTATGSAPPAESTGAGSVMDALQAGVFGAAGMAAVFLV